jgi:hypothetical protein
MLLKFKGMKNVMRIATKMIVSLVDAIRLEINRTLKKVL